MSRPSAMVVGIAVAGCAVVVFTAKALLTVTSESRRPEHAPAAHGERTPVPEIDLGFRAREVADKGWPDDVRLDVIYGRVRRGFTIEQMRMANSSGQNRLGDPERRVPATRAEGPAEAWIYGESAFVVVAGTVVDVQDARRLAIQ